MNTTDVAQLVRLELQQVITEQQAHGSVVGRSRDAQLNILRDRITTLEDALAKSEADRVASASRVETLQQSVRTLRDEKNVMAQEYKESRQVALQELQVMLTAARDESDRLRSQLTTASTRGEAEVIPLRERLKEQAAEIKKLKKILRSAATSGSESYRDPAAITIADLHYSNERLSAQLAKVQAPPLFDDTKFRECERAISSLTNELSNVEARMSQMREDHALEKRRLQQTIDALTNDFGMERAECDKIVETMATKLEALLTENNALKGQIQRLSASTPVRRRLTPRHDN